MYADSGYVIDNIVVIFSGRVKLWSLGRWVELCDICMFSVETWHLC